LNSKLAVARRYPAATVSFVLSRALYRLTKRTSPPSLIGVCLCNRCNLNCEMCCIRDTMEKRRSDETDLDFGLYEKLIQSVKRYHPAIYFSNGEPLLSENIVRAVEVAHSSGMPTSITTNGYFLHEKAEALVDAGLSYLNVSIDGDERTHDTLRRKRGSFRRALSGMRRVVEYKKERGKVLPIVKIATVITSKNVGSLDSIVGLAEKCGADGVAFQNYSFYTPEVEAECELFRREHSIDFDLFGSRLEQPPLSHEEVEMLIRFRQAMRHRADISFTPKMNSYYGFYSDAKPSTRSRCELPFTTATVRTNGDVEVCRGVVIGNLREADFMDIWHSHTARTFRELLNEHKVLPFCFRCCGMRFEFDGDDGSELENNIIK